MFKKILTLCVIREHPRVLLGMKKRGFGEGRWNGFGGKLKEGEIIEDAAKRELFEEAGIDVEKIQEVGVMDFEFVGNPEILEVHVFKGEGIIGEPSESDEMRPQWFEVDDIPFDKMWPDDIYWMPLFLADKKFSAKFLFEGMNKILNFDIKELK